MRSVLLTRTTALLIAFGAVAFLNWASGQMDLSYPAMVARCPSLPPEKIVPELGWLFAMSPAMLAILLTFVAFLGAKAPYLSKWCLVGAAGLMAIATGLTLLAGRSCPT